jgi:hypothetical protein
MKTSDKTVFLPHASAHDSLNTTGILFFLVLIFLPAQIKNIRK